MNGPTLHALVAVVALVIFGVLVVLDHPTEGYAALSAGLGFGVGAAVEKASP